MLQPLSQVFFFFDTQNQVTNIRSSLLSDDWTDTAARKHRDPIENILQIHEYDVPYHVRVSIDKNIRVGKWYTVEADRGEVVLTEIPERVARADPVVMAYDIETTKAPLKFPDSSIDKIMMISYMIDGQGYLITNREIVSQDIEDFEYTPKPEFPGLFTIFNEENERDVILRFFEHIREEKPTVIATFNGDFFDWPFVDARAKFHGISMYEEIGFQKDSEDEYKSAHCAHMDCFRWVKRDSYLPQGSQGLKAVTTAKLGYNPLEIDPELMTPYAIEKPQVMAEYSVSDAVATYYLYMKYVHPFIFSLCNIIPLNPDEVLRKGTGTLCEMLLMVQAYQGNILLPNKHKDPNERFYNGHLLVSETYVGGHVESLEAGVFRSDIPAAFKVDTTAVDELLEQLDRALKFSITVEGKKKLEDVENYDEVKNEITAKLLDLKENPKRTECPLIYHVDVASMYPNIMTTNRLQPDSMITEDDCASCDFNRPGKNCDRRLPWSWRGEFLPARKEEYLMIRNSLRGETFPKKDSGIVQAFDELSISEQSALIKSRLTEYSKKVYHKIRETETKEREAIICQRENPFYVNTVRSFRDRRYEFKGLQKVWKKKIDEIPSSDATAKEEAKKMVVLYDSLQLAHKVILNSFYGYVMRKGSRWYSMEMAGVTCLTGATIIQLARSLVERLGRPLELDTDGIWCILPKTFPEDFTFKLKDGKKLPVSYPCVMLNHLVHEKFTNHQYQTLVDEKKLKYETHSDNSIFFEVDGPYRAMILPTSKEEDKGLKKRYAVFNEDGSLAELKGFEVKRRGELRLIKAFQSQLFRVFLDGKSLTECYDAVGHVANSWLDILESQGRTLEDHDLMDLISENRSMSKTLDEYGGQKSTSICTARRLAEFLGDQMVKDKGLACKYIISQKPRGAPVTDRAVPVEIFSAEPDVKGHYLRRWLKDSSLDDFDPRAIIDWDYYTERLASAIQKIITIPAAYQGIKNPVPRVTHPDWLDKRISAQNNSMKQQSISSFFAKAPMSDASSKVNSMNGQTGVDEIRFDDDMEDIGNKAANAPSAKVAKVTVKRKKTSADQEQVEEVIPSLPSKCPDPNVDYQEFLRYSRAKWKAQKQARERRLHLFGERASAKNNTGLAGILRDQAQRAFSNTWQILEYTPSEKLGQVRVYALINGRVQTVRINVPRTIFVNFKSEKLPEGEIEKCEVTKVNHSLPNGHTSVHLFKLTMPEDVYQHELSRADSILKHHSVEGIYESHIDPCQRALLHLGSSCRLDDSRPGLLGKGLESGFELDWLEPEKSKGYLDSKDFGVIHLLHLMSRDTQVFALIPTWSQQASVFVLRPTHNAPPLPNINNAFQRALEIARKSSSSDKMMELQESIDFDVQYFDNLRPLYRKLDSALGKLQTERGTRSFVALSSVHPDRLRKLIRSLSAFPVVNVGSPKALPMTLNWQQECIREMERSYLRLGQKISRLQSLASFANVPLGNLAVNDTGYVIDVLYARRLIQSNIVLWWSPKPLPDQGGSEMDSVLPAIDSVELPVVNNPGMYTKTCVELQIGNLPINTILTASIINEAEGTVLAHESVEGESNTTIPFVENSFSTPALSALSSMVRGWWNLALEDNEDACEIVEGFFKWVACPSSRLYDWQLYYHVQNLSKKAFVQLVREIRRLGSQIVYADQGRMIISTTKASVETTYAYANYVVKYLRSQPLFNFLDVNIREYWDTLLWMDNVNYGGLCCQSVTENIHLETSLHWHVKTFLPSLLGEELSNWIIEFLHRVVESRTKHIEEHSSPSRPTQVAVVNGKEEEKHFASGVYREIEKPLMKKIKQFLRLYNDGASNPDILSQFEWPKVAGSIGHSENPVELFVKTICGIFSLPKELAFESRLFRRHLLNIIEVPEFSDQATFRNPSASLKISQFICDNCGYASDLDLCKSDDLVRNDGLGHYSFVCEQCQRSYSQVAIEEQMVKEVQKTILKYQVQDIKCLKCKRIREDDLSEHCPCSGAWGETVPYSSIKDRLETFKHVAKFYQFKLLENVIDSL